MRRLACLAPLLLLVAAPARADDRVFTITGFERIRVDGPFDVRVTTGRSVSAHASGSGQALDGLALHVEGETLVVQSAVRDWGQGGSGGPAPVITLATPGLKSAALHGGGKLAIAGMKSERVDLSLTGSGTMEVSGVAADQVTLTSIGTGRATLAGQARSVRLLSNGSGTIAAEALRADELVVHLDGAGETHAAARYLATVTDSGLGAVTVAGMPKCIVRAPAGGPVTCGAPGASSH